jgi:hypothetical protein
VNSFPHFLRSLGPSTALLGMAAFCIAAQIGVPEPKALHTKVADFSLPNQTIFDGVSELNSAAIPFSFGFERLLRAKFNDPPLPDPNISLTLRNAPVKEILDALCKADGRYIWSVDGPTINVYPRRTTDDTSYLLNRHLDKLEIKNITDIQQGLLAIAQQLPPPKEQIAHAQMGGDSSYPPEPWTTTFENLTVRQAANRLTGHMGAHSAWLFDGSQEFRAFSFFRLGFRKPSI